VQQKLMQVPHANEGQVCPLHRKDVSLVCHKCPWWTRLIGKNPQSEELIDNWHCAIAVLPMLLVENAQQSRQTGAAVETLRNGISENVIAGIAEIAMSPRMRLR
jgi:hypothetical protein